jgi:hypothetical protein
VPDPSDRAPVMRPIGAKQAPWPEADFIVGNPGLCGRDHLQRTFLVNFLYCNPSPLRFVTYLVRNVNSIQSCS